MKIAHLTPGSGKNFYCENCQRDLSVVKALRRRDCDVLMMPLYLPLQTVAGDEPETTPIFFGGVNVYLQQKLAFFRNSPRWLDRLFDHRRLLQLISRRATLVNAQSLGETTLSILSGADGRQRKELDRLIDWLALDANRPDLLCLSNLLLAGLARTVKERLNIPVVCFLQDEDEFIDALPPTYQKRAWDILRQRSADIDRFVAVSDSYRQFMQQRLALDEARFAVVGVGIELDNYTPRTEPPADLSIGYLSRMCPGKGLDVLVEAFLRLKRDPAFKTLRLKLAGGLSGDDHAYVRRLKDTLAAAGHRDDVDFLPYIEGSVKHDFLRSLSVICVPEQRPPAYGLYVLEAFALGVPAVEPDIGVFPELFSAAAPPGRLYRPNTAAALAEALAALLADRQALTAAGHNARQTAVEQFDVSHSADKLQTLYATLTGQIPC